MNEKKIETFIYHDLGFPIKLVNVSMKKKFGEWFLDINLGRLQKIILNELVHKLIPLDGAEIRFIRKYFEMTTTEFGLFLGTTHAAVLKWEKEESRMNPATEAYIRLYILDQLRVKDREFREFYHTFGIESFHKQKREKYDRNPIEIDAKEKCLASA